MILRIMQKLRAAQRRKDRCAPEDIKRWIDKNVFEDFSFENMCHDIYYTPNHIINTFRNEYGLTPYQYYLSERSKMIRNYLQDTNLSMEEIASVMHIKNAKYLSTFFRRQTGMTPSEYRKSKAAKPEDVT